jgi:hypothetical protein
VGQAIAESISCLLPEMAVAMPKILHLPIFGILRQLRARLELLAFCPLLTFSSKFEEGMRGVVACEREFLFCVQNRFLCACQLRVLPFIRKSTTLRQRASSMPITFSALILSAMTHIFLQKCSSLANKLVLALGLGNKTWQLPHPFYRHVGEHSNERRVDEQQKIRSNDRVCRHRSRSSVLYLAKIRDASEGRATGLLRNRR